MKLKKENIDEANYPDYTKHRYFGLKAIRSFAIGAGLVGMVSTGCNHSSHEKSAPRLPGSDGARVNRKINNNRYVYDSDKDGIADNIDKCPSVPEDKDNFQDEDGCPDPDNDKDGIADVDDRCPNRPETKNGFQDKDGCPDSERPRLKGDIAPVRRMPVNNNP